MVMESDLVIQETTQTARSYHENVRQKPSDALWLATSAFRPSFFSAVSAARPQMSFRSFRQNRQAVKDAYAAEREAAKDMKSSELAKNVQQVLLNSVELVSHDITLNTTEVTQSDWLQRFGRFFGPTTTSFWSRYRTVSFDSRMALNGLLANLRAQMPKGNRLQQAMLIRYFHQAMGELFGINRFGSMYFRSNADVLRLALVTVAALTLVAAVASLVAAVVVGLPSQAMVLPALLAAVSLCGMLMLRQKYHATGMFSRQAHHRERELYQWSGELRDADFVKNNQTTNLCVMNPNTVRNAVVAQLRSELPEPAHAVQPIL